MKTRKIFLKHKGERWETNKSEIRSRLQKKKKDKDELA